MRWAPKPSAAPSTGPPARPARLTRIAPGQPVTSTATHHRQQRDRHVGGSPTRSARRVLGALAADEGVICRQPATMRRLGSAAPTS